MQFRVTSVTDELFAEKLRELGNRMEDWLAATLGDTEFGVGIEQLAIVIVCMDDDAAENLRWARPYSKLGRFKGQPGAGFRFLSVSVPVAPSAVASSHALALVSGAAIDALRVRPGRLPKGFVYDRLSASAIAALTVLTNE
jgi:hypothetical protein